MRPYRIIHASGVCLLHVWHNSPDFGAAFKIEGGAKDGCQSTSRFDSKAAARRAARLYLDGTPLDEIDDLGYREPRQ